MADDFLVPGPVVIPRQQQSKNLDLNRQGNPEKIEKLQR